MRRLGWIPLLGAIASLLGCAAGDPDGPTEVGPDHGPPDALVAVVMGRGGDARVPPGADATAVLDAEAVDVGALDADRPEPPDARRSPPDAAPPPPPPLDAAPPPPDAAQPSCVAETCNGADDDCDGQIDEEPVCGAFVQERCTLTLGWADGGRGPGGISPVWSTCPGQDRQMSGDVRCTRTRRDGRFVHLDLGGDVDDNDQLAVALQCDDAAQPAVAAWIEQHCALYLGHADNNGGRAGGENWGACPPAPWSDAVPRCTSSGFDRNFRAMRLAGDVDGNDDLGLAWICRDPDQPQRALAAQAAVNVQLAWSDDNGGAPDGAADWGFACPGRVNGRVCVATLGDGRFHQLDFAGDVDDNDDLGLALKAR